MRARLAATFLFLLAGRVDEIPKLMSNEDSCLDCHSPAHKAEEKEKARS